MNGDHPQDVQTAPPDPEGVRTIGQATSAAEIHRALNELLKQGTAVTQRLNDLIATRKDVSKKLGKLDIVRAQLGTQAITTRSISVNTLADAASTAKHISGAVQKLDLEQARVKSTLEVVEQVSELRSCVLGVTGSMGAPQDWETAAGYLHKASKIPKEITCGSFAEEIVPSIEVPDPPNVTLENAAESLCGLFLREFEKAANEDNGPRVTRFFKLFPLIGRSDVGLHVYGNYVCRGVASQARSNLNAGTSGAQRKEGMFYASSLTKLFEYIAGIVERHGGLVERHYGEGRMVKVIERLQVEVDVQGGIIIDTWSEERDIDRKLTDIRSYAFTFLVQSFLSNPTSRNPTSRTASPAVSDPTAAAQSEDNDTSDMRDVDAFLNEIAIMLSRWSLYCRFLATKTSEKGALDKPGFNLMLPTLLSGSSLIRKVGDRLVGPFNQMSTFYFRRSVEKAFQLDEQPTALSLNINKSIESNPPYISSAVDDTMYIVDKVIQRTLSTSQRDVVSSVLPTIARVLSGDFIGMIQRKMRDECYPKATVQGGMPPEQTIVSFLVLVNNLDVATDYLKRIVSTKLEVPATNGASHRQGPLQDSFPFSHDATFVVGTLKSLETSFEAKTSELISDAVYVIFKNIMKPRLRVILADTFRDIDYTLSSDQIEDILRETDADGEESSEAAAVAPSAVPRRFKAGWDALTRPIARILTEANFARVLAVTVSYLGEVLEKRIWSYYGRINALGAVRLERDIAALVQVMVKGGRYALREHFTRCMQICLVMNMEEDEWEDVRSQTANEAAEWKIDAEERERAKEMVR